jgi:hypothetical protein
MSKQNKNPFEPEKFPKPLLKPEGISKLRPKGIPRPKGV